MIRGAFVTSTGTGCGKTFVSRGLVLALRARGQRVAAIKPLETGCTPDPLDALALARAAAEPELAHGPQLYRVAPPLSPYAVTLEGAAPAPDLGALRAAVIHTQTAHDFTLVEGAGGLLVPLDATRTMADFARALGYPLVLVAPDRLGVLSHVLCTWESAFRRSLPVLAVVLVQLDAERDPSTRTNARILAARLPVPVLTFDHVRDDDAELQRAAEASGLLELLAS